MRNLYFILLFLIASFQSKGQCSTSTGITGYFNPHNVVVTCYGAPTSTNFNYAIDISYNVEIPPGQTIYSMQAELHCGTQVISFNIPNTGGLGDITVSNVSNSGSSSATCATANETSLDCIGNSNLIFRSNSSGGYEEINCPTASSSMPVSLRNFSGKYKSAVNTLTWEITSESEFDYFIVEKSNDAKSFESISPPLKHEGNHDFTWQDDDVKLNKKFSYYRLRMVDLNGEKAYSKIITVNHFNPKMQWTLGPNPASGQLIIKVNPKDFRPRRISIFDSNGILVLEENTASFESYDLNLSKLSPNNYLLRLTDEFNRTLSKKINIQ